METLTLDAFNVPGLPKPYKQQKLIRNVTRYRIGSFKKTKVEQLLDTIRY